MDPQVEIRALEGVYRPRRRPLLIFSYVFLLVASLGLLNVLAASFDPDEPVATHSLSLAVFVGAWFIFRKSHNSVKEIRIGTRAIDVLPLGLTITFDDLLEVRDNRTALGHRILYVRTSQRRFVPLYGSVICIGSRSWISLS